MDPWKEATPSNLVNYITPVLSGRQAFLAAKGAEEIPGPETPWKTTDLLQNSGVSLGNYRETCSNNTY
jgi:hypothetical protein